MDDFLNQSYGTSLNQGSLVGLLLVLKVDLRRKNKRGEKKLRAINKYTKDLWKKSLRNNFDYVWFTIGIYAY